MEIIGNVLYGQSGGPTSVINSSAFGLIEEAYKFKLKLNLMKTNDNIEIGEI